MKSVGTSHNRHGRRRQDALRAAGFTLIELMLVLVILATLAAIVLPKFTGRSQQAKVTGARTQIANFETALSAFEIDLSRYPTTTEGLRALVQKPTSDAEGWLQPYLSREEVPKDPWGNEYMYRYPGQHNEHGYDLYSVGPDHKMGGDDDITNWSTEN
jgi:general secretion pathway protein G